MNMKMHHITTTIWSISVKHKQTDKSVEKYRPSSNRFKYSWKFNIWQKEDMSFPGGSVVKNPPVMEETWLGRFPGEGNVNLLQYSCLGNPMGIGIWQATVHGVIKELDTT